MKKLLFILLACLISISSFSQKRKVDQIIKTSGIKITAKVISTKGDKITYQIPGESFVVQLKKEEVEKIIFHDGKIVEFTSVEKIEEEIEIKEEKETIIIEEKTITKADLDSLDWVNIKVTEDPNEITGLKEIGAISGFAEGGKLNTPTSVLLSHAMVDIRKEAALIQAHTVLIKEINHTRGYGDLPTTTMEGVAYGD